MKATIRNWKSNVPAQVIATILLANFTFAGTESPSHQIAVLKQGRSQRFNPISQWRPGSRP